MSDTWKQWQGLIVDEKFPLVRYLGGSEHCGVFLTERREGEHLLKAAIKLVPASQENREFQLSRWRQAAELSHPHLIPLYEMGQFDLGGQPLVYVVMECAEENLAQVLPIRALTPTEARAMLGSVLNVLRYLHSKGFVHGHIKPANIMASGEELKISSDGLYHMGELREDSGDQDAYDAPENAGGVLSPSKPMSPAGDVWSLGVTLVETLTQNLPDARTAEHQDPLLPQTLSESFLNIASHCLRLQPQARWTVAQIAAHLEGRAPMLQDVPGPSKFQTPERASLPNTQNSSSSSTRHRYAVAIAVGFALVLAAILAGPRLLRRHAQPPPISAAADEPPLVAPAPSEAAPPPQKHPIKSARPLDAEQELSSKAPVAVPTSIHPEAIHEEAASSAELPAGSLVHGDVAHRVSPEVLQSAVNSIRGTVRVRVKVNVDRSGNVEDAEIESRGPSKYFARAALEAAQLWKFKPPTTGNRGVLSSWTLEFEFTRDGTTVVPMQEMP
jgi:TonB family protein